MARDLMSFKDIENGMLWRGGAIEMIEGFARLDELVGGDGTVAGSHWSKSIELPMLGWKTPAANVIVLDNFYEFNLHYNGEPSPDLSYEECGYHPMTAERYLEEIARCEGYTWKGWSQEDIEDPNMLCVEALTMDGRGTYWNQRSAEEKQRWLKRFESAEWVEHDWSASSIVGDVAAVLKGGGVLYRATRTFTDYTGIYKPGARQFSLAFKSGADALSAPLIRKLLRRS